MDMRWYACTQEAERMRIIFSSFFFNFLASIVREKLFILQSSKSFIYPTVTSLLLPSQFSPQFICHVPVLCWSLLCDNQILKPFIFLSSNPVSHSLFTCVCHSSPQPAPYLTHWNGFDNITGNNSKNPCDCTALLSHMWGWETSTEISPGLPVVIISPQVVRLTRTLLPSDPTPPCSDGDALTGSVRKSWYNLSVIQQQRFIFLFRMSQEGSVPQTGTSHLLGEFKASHTCDPQSGPCLDMTFLKAMLCRS